jgi:hypothetical protein
MGDKEQNLGNPVVPLALNIVVTREEVPIGVMVPVTDWLKIKPHLHPDSPLYALLEKLAREYEAMDGGLRVEEEIEQDPPDGTYIRYKDETCTDEHIYIQEYADRRVRVRVHPKTETYEFIERID